MKVGDVIYFESDQAQGYGSKKKYHVYLGPTDHFRAHHEHVFIFISSADYGGCFPVLRSDCGFLDYDSFISCGKLLFYSVDYIQNANAQQVGALAVDVLKRLRSHLAASYTMAQWEINVACKALDGAT